MAGYYVLLGVAGFVAVFFWVGAGDVDVGAAVGKGRN